MIVAQQKKEKEMKTVKEVAAYINALASANRLGKIREVHTGIRIEIFNFNSHSKKYIKSFRIIEGFGIEKTSENRAVIYKRK